MTARKPADEHLPTGRPSKFKASMVKLVKKLATSGMTEREIADCLEVSPKTLTNWKANHPKLAQALVPGKRAANQRVEASLYHRALGYSYDVVRKIEKPSKIEGQPPEIEIITQEVHYPPSEGAMTLWLTNRDKKRWKSRQSTELSTDPGRPLEVRHTFTTEEMMNEFYTRAAAEAADGAEIESAAEDQDDE